jgi:hypothetical protein
MKVPASPGKQIAEMLHDLLYAILMALVLVPKTLFTIATAPVWIVRYLETELQGSESKERFHSYSHPITFFVLVAVAPAMALTPVFRVLARMVSGRTFLLVSGVGIGGQMPFTVPSDFSQFVEDSVAALGSLNAGIKFLAFFVLLISWPLSTALVIQGVRFLSFKKPAKDRRRKDRGSASRPISFTPTGLRLLIYSQSYIYGALIFCHYLGMIFFAVYPAAFFSQRAQWLIIVFPELYFAYCELRIIREQARVGLLSGLCIFALTFFAGMVSLLVCEFIVLFPALLSYMWPKTPTPR